VNTSLGHLVGRSFRVRNKKQDAGKGQGSRLKRNKVNTASKFFQRKYKDISKKHYISIPPFFIPY